MSDDAEVMAALRTCKTIPRISSETGLPRHRVRYAMRRLVRGGLAVCSKADRGAVPAEYEAATENPMTDPVREAFEQWVLREYGRDYPDPQVLLERNSLNDYAMNRVRDAWPSWQASRALALEQLEAMCAIKAGVVVGEAAAQYLRGRQDCVDLIRALKEGV